MNGKWEYGWKYFIIFVVRTNFHSCLNTTKLEYIIKRFKIYWNILEKIYCIIFLVSLEKHTEILRLFKAFIWSVFYWRCSVRNMMKFLYVFGFHRVIPKKNYAWKLFKISFVLKFYCYFHYNFQSFRMK